MRPRLRPGSRDINARPYMLDVRAGFTEQGLRRVGWDLYRAKSCVEQVSARFGITQWPLPNQIFQ